MGKIGQGIQAGIGILVLAGGVGAFYVFNHDPALKQRLLQDVGAEDKPAPQPPANAPVGFNAARTAFVLPHKLGYLPAPELELAKSDPTYAAGLANLGDWYHYSLPGVMQGGPTRWYWLYDSGVSERSAQGGALMVKLGVEDVLADPFGASVRDHVLTTRVVVYARSYHVIPGYDVLSDVIAEYVGPSRLEIVAAPIRGSLSGLGTFCVPSPLAFVESGRVVTLPGLPPITAGPSTVFGPTNSGGIWDQGITSCNGFS
jgi:hypothetical protein